MRRVCPPARTALRSLWPAALPALVLLLASHSAPSAAGKPQPAAREFTRDVLPILFYTGITRGKRLVVVVGTRKALEMAVQRQDMSQRCSALSRRLKEKKRKRREKGVRFI